MSGCRGGYCPKQCGTNALCCRKGYKRCPMDIAAVNSGGHKCVSIGYPWTNSMYNPYIPPLVSLFFSGRN